MSPLLIPSILMVGLIVSHTLAIQFLRKQRAKLDAHTLEGAQRAKSLGLIITILYVEIPVITALIWLVIAPLVGPVDN